MEQANKKYKEKSKKLFKKVANNSEQIRSDVRAAAEKARKKSEETTDIINGYSNEPGTLKDTMTFKQKIELASKLKNNHKLNEISKIAGRFRRLALHKQATKVKHGFDDIVSIEQGNDLGRILPVELVKLKHPLLKLQFYRDFTEKSLLQYKMEGKEKVGQGPMVVLIDESGSMSGKREIWAKGFALGLMSIARKQKRTFAVVHFSGSDSYKKVIFKNGMFSSDKMVEMVEHFFGGGTCFETPLRKARGIIKGEKKDFEKSDIVLITDGEAEITQDTIDKQAAMKKEFGTTLYTIVIKNAVKGELNKISDKVVTLNNLEKDDQAIDIYSL